MLLYLTVHMMQDVMELIGITKNRLSVRKHFRIEYSPLLEGIEWQVSGDLGFARKLSQAFPFKNGRLGERGSPSMF